jgi:hypothetical protein
VSIRLNHVTDSIKPSDWTPNTLIHTGRGPLSARRRKNGGRDTLGSESNSDENTAAVLG